MIDSEMVDIGTNAATDNAIDFATNITPGTFNISGSVLINDSLFENDNAVSGTTNGNAFENNAIRIDNQDTVILDVDVTNTTFRESTRTASSAVQVSYGEGATGSVNVTDSQAINVRGELLFLISEDNGSAADVNFMRNEVRNTKTPGNLAAEIGAGVVLAANKGGTITFDIIDNCPSAQAGCTSGVTGAGLFNLFLDPVDVSANNDNGFNRTSLEGRINRQRIENSTGDQIGIFGDGEAGLDAPDADGISGIIQIDNNVLEGGAGPTTTSSQNGIDIKWRQGPGTGSAEANRRLDLSVTNNDIGVATKLNDDGVNALDLSNDVSGSGVATAMVIKINMQDNDIFVSDDSAVSLDIQTEGTLHGTIENNTQGTTSADSLDESLELKIDEDATGHFDIDSNTLTTTTAFDIELDRDDLTSTFNVLQTDVTNLSTVNGGASVDVSDEAVTFNSGVTPTLPTLPGNP
jgi:hypothetical protein